MLEVLGSSGYIAERECCIIVVIVAAM
jgi:hypothetical protein